MLLNWAKTSHGWLIKLLFTKPWYTPLLLVAIYAVLFVYFMPFGVLTREKAYVTSGFLSTFQMGVLGIGLLLISVVLKKFAEMHPNLTIKEYIVYIGVCALPFFFTYPVEALDYISNLWYSERIVEYGENPYTTKYSPQSDYSRTNLPAVPESPYMPYGPVWIFLHTFLYFPIRQLPFPVIMFIIKIVSAGMLGVTMVNVLRTTKLLAPHNLSTIAAFGMSPLMLFSFIGTLHNDILFIMFLSLAVHALCTQRHTRMLFWFTLSIFTKYVSVILVPILLFFLWNELKRKDFFMLVLPWLAVTIPVGLFFVLRFSILNGIVDQSNLLGFSFTSAFAFLTNSQAITSHVATILMSGFLILYVLFTLSFRTELKQRTLSEYLTAMMITLLIFMLYYLQLFLYWYFMWLLPLIVTQPKQILSPIAWLAYAYLFEFLFSWHLFLKYHDGTITFEMYHLSEGIVQLLVVSVAFYLLHQTIIIPAARKLL